MIDMTVLLWLAGCFALALAGWYQSVRYANKIEQLKLMLSDARLTIARYATLLGMPDEQIRAELESFRS